jgi:hypothetical protein
MLKSITYEWRTDDGCDALEEEQKPEGIRQSRGPQHHHRGDSDSPILTCQMIVAMPILQISLHLQKHLKIALLSTKKLHCNAKE